MSRPPTQASDAPDLTMVGLGDVVVGPELALLDDEDAGEDALLELGCVETAGFVDVDDDNGFVEELLDTLTDVETAGDELPARAID